MSDIPSWIKDSHSAQVWDGNYFIDYLNCIKNKSNFVAIIKDLIDEMERSKNDNERMKNLLFIYGLIIETNYITQLGHDFQKTITDKLAYFIKTELQVSHTLKSVLFEIEKKLHL
jgi:hypothetical protein